MGETEASSAQFELRFSALSDEAGRCSPIARGLLPPIEQWPSIDEFFLTPERRSTFLARRAAVQMYLAGSKTKEITAQTGLSRTFFYRLLRRATAIHPDGRMWGLRALIPWIRSDPVGAGGYRRSPGDPTWSGPGAFRALLNRHPELDKFIRDRVLKRAGAGMILESRQPIIKLHIDFLNECRRLGLNPIHDYPFTGKRSGYTSLATHIRRIKAESSSRAVAIVYGEQAAKKLQVGDGSMRPVHFPYERVECDAHHIDAIFCILLANANGDVFPLVLPRLWILVIKDVASRVILGYYLSLNKECTQEDLIKCIQRALTSWTPRDLSKTHIRYARGAGFPSSLGDKFVGACWNEFSVDGAKINMSERVGVKLQTIVGSTVLLLRRRIPDDRPFVERFFGTLEEEGCHRLPNTTGSSPIDIRRKNPEVAACKYFIQLEDLENLLDVLISNYNATAHSSLGGRTPLEYLAWSQQRCEDFHPTRHVTPEAVKRLRAIHAAVRVRGGRGRRPFISFSNATYSCPAFSHAQDLVGKSITIEADPDDGRVVFAYLPDGQELGPLTAGPPWNREPHTFQMRRMIVARIRERKWQRDDFLDPVKSLLLDLEERVRASGKISSDYLELRQYLLERREEFRAFADEGSREKAKFIAASPAVPRHIETPILSVPRMAKQS